MTNNSAQTPKIPPQEDKKALNVIALEIWEHYFSNYAFIPIDGKRPLIGREFCEQAGAIIDKHLNQQVNQARIDEEMTNSAMFVLELSPLLMHTSEHNFPVMTAQVIKEIYAKYSKIVKDWPDKKASLQSSNQDKEKVE